LLDAFKNVVGGEDTLSRIPEAAHAVSTGLDMHPLTNNSDVMSVVAEYCDSADQKTLINMPIRAIRKGVDIALNFHALCKQSDVFGIVVG
jgi:hypothetical protein